MSRKADYIKIAACIQDLISSLEEKKYSIQNVYTKGDLNPMVYLYWFIHPQNKLNLFGLFILFSFDFTNQEI